MAFTKKIAIAVNLGEEIPKVFDSLKEIKDLQGAEIHLVYSFLTTSYYVSLSGDTYIYPIESERKVIESSSLAQLKKLSERLFPGIHEKVIIRCLFANETKRAFCDYVEKEKIDLAVLATRQKRGLFESSFTRYVENHSHANVLVLKQHG